MDRLREHRGRAAAGACGEGGCGDQSIAAERGIDDPGRCAMRCRCCVTPAPMRLDLRRSAAASQRASPFRLPWAPWGRELSLVSGGDRAVLHPCATVLPPWPTAISLTPSDPRIWTALSSWWRRQLISIQPAACKRTIREPISVRREHGNDALALRCSVEERHACPVCSRRSPALRRQARGEAT